MDEDKPLLPPPPLLMLSDYQVAPWPSQWRALLEAAAKYVNYWLFGRWPGQA